MTEKSGYVYFRIKIHNNTCVKNQCRIKIKRRP
jgi:hypothetical protein